jgi:hypothetical protein
MSRSNFGGVIPDVNRTHTPSTAKNRPRRSKDLLSDTEKEQLKRPVLHHLYQNRHNPWTKTTTLKQLLGERRYCREEFAHTHLQLAMLLGMSYVNLGSKGEARIFRPEDVTYFRPEESQERDTHYDLVLSPFLRVRSRKLQQIGTGNGFPLGRREATLELGLLL